MFPQILKNPTHPLKVVLSKKKTEEFPNEAEAWIQIFYSVGFHTNQITSTKNKRKKKLFFKV